MVIFDLLVKCPLPSQAARSYASLYMFFSLLLSWYRDPSAGETESGDGGNRGVTDQQNSDHGKHLARGNGAAAFLTPHLTVPVKRDFSPGETREIGPLLDTHHALWADRNALFTTDAKLRIERNRRTTPLPAYTLTSFTSVS